MGAAAVAIKQQSDYQFAVGETHGALEVAANPRPQSASAEVISFLTPLVTHGVDVGDKLIDALRRFLPMAATHLDETQLIYSALESSVEKTKLVVELGRKVQEKLPHYWTVDMQRGYEEHLEELDSIHETLGLVLNRDFQTEITRRIDAAEANSVVDDEQAQD